MCLSAACLTDIVAPVFLYFFLFLFVVWSPALMGIAPSGRLPLWQINTLSLSLSKTVAQFSCRDAVYTGINTQRDYRTRRMLGVEVSWKDATQRGGSAWSAWLVTRDGASYARRELRGKPTANLPVR